MRAFARLVAGFAAVASLSLTAQDKVQEPTTWGMLSGTSCVIFAEGHKTSGRFYGIAATTKTVSKLTFLEAQNYTFTQKEILETQENMDNLMQLARKDHIKFVKIPEKYSPDLLEKARGACKPDTQ